MSKLLLYTLATTYCWADELPDGGECLAEHHSLGQEKLNRHGVSVFQITSKAAWGRKGVELLSKYDRLFSADGDVLSISPLRSPMMYKLRQFAPVLICSCLFFFLGAAAQYGLTTYFNQQKTEVPNLDSAASMSSQGSDDGLFPVELQSSGLESHTVSNTKRSSTVQDFEVTIAAAKGLSHDDVVEEFWKKFENDKEPNLFGMKDVRIAHDGGMSDIPNLPQRRFAAARILLFCFVNCTLVIRTDISSLYAPKSVAVESRFLLSRVFVGMFVDTGQINFEKCMPFLELVCLVLLIARMIVYAITAMLAPKVSSKHGAFIRWTYAIEVFWFCIPQLASFSALRLLYHLTPDVLRSDGHILLLHTSQRLEGATSIKQHVELVFGLIRFVLLRIVSLILGIDAFFTKFRAASKSIDMGAVDTYSTLMAVAFLWQVMCIVDLKFFVRDRLFIFLFAAEDGNLDFDEAALADVWKAILCQRVYQYFGAWNGTIVMLGFDDYDFQRLAFEDNEKGVRSLAASRIKERKTLSEQRVLDGTENSPRPQATSPRPQATSQSSVSF